MKSNEIRNKFLEFFKKRGHTIIPSASLVPENDPTTLFTGSGMQPLLLYLLGEKHPLGTRLADSQKSFRAEDIDEVGDNRHTTFFEMLGNWSLGDYFKEEQLPWFFEFMTEEVGLPADKLYVTVFSGDEKAGIPRDDESVAIWKKLFAGKGLPAKDVELLSEANASEKGMQGGRIFYYDSKKNWWSRAGAPENMPEGEPGGPDSEVFFDFGTPHDPRFGKECHPNCDCGRFLEIGNSVFMEYVKKADGSFEKLAQRNVDFGGGLERITAAANGNRDVFSSVDTLSAVIKKLEELSGKKYGEKEFIESFRIVADHIRGAVFMMGDGVFPSNAERGYFVRRLIRRSVRHMDILGIRENSLGSLAGAVAENYTDPYPNLLGMKEAVGAEIEKEEEKFRKTLESGLKYAKKIGFFEFDKYIAGSVVRHGEPRPEDLFELYTTYGFPPDLAIEELERVVSEKQSELLKHGYMNEPYWSEEKRNKLIQGFKNLMDKHKQVSRAGSEQKFKGGLSGAGGMELKYHTATHLLNEALRRVLGPHISQKGSNITPERMRFDFSHGEKLSDEDKKKVEDLVNEKIKMGLPVRFEEMPLEKAREAGAQGVFGEKYGERVKVYSIGDFSKEICGGPHVENTAELGKFKITKEEAVSAGVRRIRAVLE